MSIMLWFDCDDPGPLRQGDKHTSWLAVLPYHLRRAGVVRRKRERHQQTIPSKYPAGAGHGSTAYHPVSAMNGSSHS
jgi:hypothetical protein